MKRINVALMIGIAVLGAIALTGCSKDRKSDSAGRSAAAPYTIEVGGSTSVTPLMELFYEEYQKEKPHIKVNINGTGSGDGINNAGKLYQIGMSSRELTAVEQGGGIKETIIAIDGIAVIMNNESPVTNLTRDQIKGIYTGTITDWSQISGGAKNGRIAVVSRESGSGTRGAFEELIGFQGELVAGATESTSTGAIKAGIAQNVNAIGYISIGSVDNTIKAVSVDGIEPISANIVNGSYKIARPFIVLTGANVHGESQAFIDWMLSSAGQSVVKRSWIPVN